MDKGVLVGMPVLQNGCEKGWTSLFLIIGLL